MRKKIDASLLYIHFFHEICKIRNIHANTGTCGWFNLQCACVYFRLWNILPHSIFKHLMSVKLAGDRCCCWKRCISDHEQYFLRRVDFTDVTDLTES